MWRGGAAIRFRWLILVLWIAESASSSAILVASRASGPLTPADLGRESA